MWTAVVAPSLGWRSRLDVFYSPSNIVPPVTHCPSVVTIHDVNFLLQPDAYDRAYAQYAELMFGVTARRAAHVITDSEFSKRALVA